MTVAISIKVHDGLVLASDSAATIFDSDGNGGLAPINVYNNANKVFNLHRGLGIGGMVWGAGSIGYASIATLTKDLRVRLEGRVPRHRKWAIDPSDYTVKHVAELTREFLFEEHYQHHYRKETERSKKPSFGFMVAGYSSGADLAEEWAFAVESGECPNPELIRKDNACGWVAFGEKEPIDRLLHGFAPGLEQVLGGVLANQPGLLPQLMALIRQQLEARLVLPPMPIKDAIDLAEGLVHLCSMYYRFHEGAQIVGGPIEVAAITKHEGFKWIKRKYYYSRDLNPPREAPYEDRTGQRKAGKGHRKPAKRKA